jgi:hypothetical protein
MARKAEPAHTTPDREVSPTPRLALSIIEFCKSHGISQGFYFKLRAQGLGPREMRLGSRTLVTLEAAAAWRAERENASAEIKSKPVAPSPPVPPAPPAKGGRAKVQRPLLRRRSAPRENAHA